MPRLHSRRHFLYQSAALAAGLYGSRAFSDDGEQTQAIPDANLNGCQTDEGAIATAISAGLLGNLREVICWSQDRSSNMVPARDEGGLRARGCELLAGPFRALGLAHPSTIYAAGSTQLSAGVPEAMAVRYEFPEQAGRPGLVLTWYDGEWAPPYESVDGFALSERGTLYLGQVGQLLDDGVTGRRVLLRDGERPRDLPAHAAEPLRFEPRSGDELRNVSAAVMAGIVSYRVQQSLDWDGPSMTARNCEEAAAVFRQSWNAAGIV